MLMISDNFCKCENFFNIGVYSGGTIMYTPPHRIYDLYSIAVKIMTTQKKDCFGILESVFPMGKEGLREIVPACFECLEKKTCLQVALKTEEGFRLRSEILDRSPANGFSGRLQTVV